MARDLIDRASIFPNGVFYVNGDNPMTSLDELINRIRNIPTVDAVSVIRCRDCKHWSDGVAGCTDHIKCCKIGFYMVGENGYCVYGEAKDGN
jgi:hypothetical protein